MNSRLLYHERGRVLPRDFHPCERPISTRLSFPDAATDAAELFILALKASEDASPLVVTAGKETYSVDTPVTGRAQWLRCAIDPAALEPGAEAIGLPAQSGWHVAVEPASGEPVIRLRIMGPGHAAEPVFPAYGDPGIQREADSWRALLPESLRELDNQWDWCWRLAGFLSSAWNHTGTREPQVPRTSYSPWDARVILRWARADKDDEGNKPVAYCVHYAVCFVQLCTLMDVPARSMVLTGDNNAGPGHFVAEVWLDEHESWAMIDPNLHICYRDPETGRPLATAELHPLGNALADRVQIGEGLRTQPTAIENGMKEHYLNGAVYRHWGVWRRHDWIDRADQAPPGHGMVCYPETDIIWCDQPPEARSHLGMFPHFLSPEELSRPPS